MSFRESTPKELVELERKAYGFMRKNLRGISKEKAEKRISYVQLQGASQKMFATVYSMPRIEALERGMGKAISEYRKPKPIRFGQPSRIVKKHKREVKTRKRKAKHRLKVRSFPDSVWKVRK